MGPIIDHGIDCDGAGIVRGKRHIYPAKTDPSNPPLPPPVSGEAVSTMGTNINHEGLHWTANEYAENVGSVKT